MGCAAPAVAPTPSTTAAEAVPSPKAVLAASAPSLSGTVRSADKGALVDATWFLQKPGFEKPTASGPLPADGTFASEVPLGIYIFGVRARDHEPVYRALYLDRAEQIEVRIKAKADAAEVAITNGDALTTSIDTFQRRWLMAIQKLEGPNRKTELTQLSDEARATLESRSLPPREVALLRAVHFSLFRSAYLPEALRSENAWLLENLPPAEPRLAVVKGLGGLDSATESSLAQSAERWREALIKENPEASVAADAIATEAYRADQARDDVRLSALCEASRAPRFAGTNAAKDLALNFAPDRLLQRGKPVPDFAFASLDGKARVTKASLAGRPYLLEFWSTTCAPCVTAMAKVHEAYVVANHAPKPKDLTHLKPVKRPTVDFVFVSVDEKPEDARKFRAEKWSMPWIHAYAAKDPTTLGNELGIRGVPTMVLVDAKGIVLEVNGGLKGPKLAETLTTLVPR